MRTFAAQSRLLDSAERYNLGRYQASVDPDHPVFESLGDAPDSAYIPTEEITSEAEFGGVGEFDSLLVGVKTEKGGDWPEGFFASNFHFGGHAGEDRGLKEGAAETMPFTSLQHLGPFGKGIGNMFLHFFHGRHVNQWTLDDVGFETVPNFQLPDGLHQLLREGVINGVLDIQPVSADTRLTGVPEFGDHGSFDSDVEVRIIKDD